MTIELTLIGTKGRYIIGRGIGEPTFNRVAQYIGIKFTIVATPQYLNQYAILSTP